MARTFGSVEEFASVAGQELGVSSWFTMTQERIDAFADVTEDWQWIHVDPERAAASDLGRTVAHGYLVAALVPRLSSEVFDFDLAGGVGRAVSYGLDGVRFPGFVHPGDRIRLHARMESTELRAGGVLGRVGYTLEVEGRDRPGLVAHALMIAFGPEESAPAAQAAVGRLTPDVPS